mgnify:CR=1 FL=1
MIIYNFLYFYNLDTISHDKEYEAIWLCQIHSILPCSITRQPMAVTNMSQNQYIHIFCDT